MFYATLGVATRALQANTEAKVKNEVVGSIPAIEEI